MECNGHKNTSGCSSHTSDGSLCTGHTVNGAACTGHVAPSTNDEDETFVCTGHTAIPENE